MHKVLVCLLIGLLLVSCATTKASAPIDPFFLLPVTPPPEGNPVEPLAHPVDGQILLEFTLHDGDEKLTAPGLVVDDASQANVSILDELSFVADFDIETAEDAWIAEPIIETVTAGLSVDVTPSIRKDGAVHLEFRIAWSDVEEPLRLVSTKVGDGTGAPVHIQVPAMNVVAVAGKAELIPGVVTSLALLPRWMDGEAHLSEVRVRAYVIGQDPGGPAPNSTKPGAIQVSLVRLTEVGPGEIRHLDRPAGDQLLSREDTEVLKQFRLLTGLVPGVELGARRQISYLQDFDVEVASSAHLSDPIIGTVTEGFSATMELEDGTPALLWSYDRMMSLDTFTTSLTNQGSVVTIELPELLKLSGSLPLRAPVNVMGIAELDTGGTLALVVLLP